MPVLNVQMRFKVKVTSTANGKEIARATSSPTAEVVDFGEAFG
jgi:hypothetical protein